MMKLRTFAIVSTLCLTAGVGLADMKPHGTLKGHGNLVAAEKSLAAASAAISKSQADNECVFGVEGGHGAKAKEAIDAAAKEVWDAAEYVNTHEKDCAGLKPGKVVKASMPSAKGHPALKNHANLIAAEKDLMSAYESITKSQNANECVFGLEGGHGDKAKNAIDVAFKQVIESADWVNTHEMDCKANKKK